MATRYPDAPDDGAAVGNVFERFICDRHGLRRLVSRADQFTHGDAVSGVAIYHEIKHDPHIQYKKGLMIEVAEKTALDNPWVLSGIFASSDAWYYWHGESNSYWRFAKQDLIKWAESKEITSDIVLRHLNGGTRNPLLIEFNGTMLRMRMTYKKANELGWRPLHLPPTHGRGS